MSRRISGYYSDDDQLSSSPSSYSSCDSVDEIFERYREYRLRVQGLVQSLSDLDDNMVINQGTNSSRQPQLCFHTIHGSNVELKQGNRIARRKESFCRGLAFSNRPITVNENVCLRLTEVATNWSGVLRFGVTNVDPDTYRTTPVPKFACPDLTSKEGYWAKALPERFSTQGNILHFYVTTAGELFYGVNGSQKGIFLCGINTSLPLWIIVDIYGNSVSVEFVDSSEFRGSGARSRSTSTQSRVTSGIPNPTHVTETTTAAAQLTTPSTSPSNLDRIRFHPTHGRHIVLQQDRSVACRMMQEYTQGYVFTERPVNINEKIVVQIMEVQQLFNGGLAFGVTCCDPSTLRTVELPDNSGDLVEMPQYWVGIQDIALQPAPNTILTFWITDTAEVVMQKGAGAPRTVLHVDTSIPLYMWWDCYGSTQSIKLIGYSRSQSPRRTPTSIPAKVALPTIPAITRREAGSSPRRSTETAVPAALRVDMRSASRTSAENTSRASASSSSSHFTIDELLGGPPLPPTTAPPPPSIPAPARPPALVPRTPRTIPAPPSRPPPPTPSTPSYNVSPPITAAPTVPPPILPRPTATLEALLGKPRIETPSTASPSSSLAGSMATLSVDNDEIDPSEECTVCMSAKIDAVIYTCGHMCMCYTCAKQTAETQGHCPLCRNPIKDVIKCYKS